MSRSEFEIVYSLQDAMKFSLQKAEGVIRALRDELMVSVQDAKCICTLSRQRLCHVMDLALVRAVLYNVLYNFVRGFILAQLDRLIFRARLSCIAHNVQKYARRDAV